MLYTTGFMAAGMLAAALTLSASSSVAHGIAEEEAATGRHPLRLSSLLSTSDVDALERLSAALGAHTVWRHELTDPDHDIADHALAAAETASGETRETLLSLAASARRSALAFLVDYNLAAGGWEAAAGVRMSSPALERL